MLKEVRGTEALLSDHPLLKREVSNNGLLNLVGHFKLNSVYLETTITEDFELRIVIPQSYPKVAPQVYEIGGKIPSDEKFHKNGDGSLCLGSPIKQLFHLGENDCLSGFLDSFLVPYLTGVTLLLEKKVPRFPWGELDHGKKGLLDEYSEMFKVPDTHIKGVLRELSIRKRVSNKHPCPHCKCKRLGVCDYHYWINKFRKLLPRSQYRRQLDYLD